MKYAFELPDIPTESDYLEVLYPVSKRSLAFFVFLSYSFIVCAVSIEDGFNFAHHKTTGRRP